MGELTDTLRDFLDAYRVGVLATVGSDGNPRQSVVYYVRDGNRLLISTESKRLKAQDVIRTGRASICIRGDEQPYPSATFSGPAEILTEEKSALRRRGSCSGSPGWTSLPSLRPTTHLRRSIA